MRAFTMQLGMSSLYEGLCQQAALYSACNTCKAAVNASLHSLQAGNGPYVMHICQHFQCCQIQQKLRYILSLLNRLGSLFAVAQPGRGGVLAQGREVRLAAIPGRAFAYMAPPLVCAQARVPLPLCRPECSCQLQAKRHCGPQ